MTGPGRLPILRTYCDPAAISCYRLQRDRGPEVSVTALQLSYPVCLLDGTELFAGGTVLSEATVRETRRRHPPRSGGQYSLLKHGTVFNDLFDLMSQPPYGAIYVQSGDRETILALIKNSMVQPIVLESLDYFHTRDLYTYRHALMVFALSLLLARHLGLPGRDVEKAILNAGPSHDLGKICIPLPILSKSAALTVSERRLLEHHTAAGYALLAWYTGDLHSPAARMARDHHERTNGSGYPQGIALNDILVEIIAACDIYDALVSSRPYRSTSFDNRTALEELTELASQDCLRREILQALVSLNRNNRPRVETCVVSFERRGTPPADNRYGMTAPEPGQQPPDSKS